MLVTGFEPFGTDHINPSALVAQALHGRQVAAHRIHGLVLPTAFELAPDCLLQALTTLKPRWVFALGLAGNRSAISIERVAINVIDARIPDNEGTQPIDVPVRPRAPAAYFSTLPIPSMVKAVKEAGIAVEVSNTAGTFVCNQVFYVLMHALGRQAKHTPCRAGFIHLPPTEEMGGPGAMPWLQLLDGVKRAIRAALLHRSPQGLPGGGPMSNGTLS